MPGGSAETTASIGIGSKFYFEVLWGDAVMHFQEITGLEFESTTVQGDSPSVSVIPGMRKFSNVTLRRGTFKPDAKVWAWFNQLKMNTARRVPVTIRLLDEAGSTPMVWTLANAFPTQITSTDLKAEGGEVAVESMVVVYEGLTISNAQ